MFGDKQVIHIVNYFFAQSGKPLTAKQIRSLKIDKETRVPTLKGEEITWNEEKKQTRQTRQTIKTIIYPHGKRITVGAFLRRDYFYEDDKQNVSKSDQRKFKIDDAGVVRVNGRVIIWKNEKSLPANNLLWSPEKETQARPSSSKRKREEARVSDGISSGLTFFNSKAQASGNTHTKNQGKDLQPPSKKKLSLGSAY